MLTDCTIPCGVARADSSPICSPVLASKYFDPKLYLDTVKA